MGRKRTTKSLDGLKRVYWYRNQWQYKATTEERQAKLKSWEPLGPTDTTARLRYAEIKNSIGSLGGMTLLFDKFEAEVVAKKKAKETRDDDMSRIKKLRPVFGHTDPRLIKPKDIQKYVDIRADTSINRARKEYSLLNQLFNRCKVWIDLEINPCDGVKLPAKPKSRSRLPEPWEIAEVRKFASDQLKLYIDLKFATGLDQKVLRELLLEDVLKSNIAEFISHGNQIDIGISMLKEEGVAVARFKTGVKGFVSWSPDLMNTIVAIFKLRKAEGRTGATLFCSSRNTKWSKDTFNNNWQAAKKAALKNGALKENFTEHDMRASHLQAAEALGFDGTTQLLHNDKRTTEIYRRSKEVKRINPVNLEKARLKK